VITVIDDIVSIDDQAKTVTIPVGWKWMFSEDGKFRVGMSARLVCIPESAYWSIVVGKAS
jgi:hypothetical protein